MYCKPQQAEWFADFVGQLIGLKREIFLAAMRAIRTYVTGMHRLGDDLDDAYTLLVSSLEPLLPPFDTEEPTWDDYPEHKRRLIDRALRGADKQTHRLVKQILLGLDKHSVTRRFRLLVDGHLDAAFFREEATARISPIGRSELHRCLKQAYALRSKYLHASKELPRELTLIPANRAETARIGRGTTLTVEGLSRLARHVLLQCISRQEPVAKEPCDYSGEEPGIIRAELAPEYWMHRPGNFSAKDGAHLTTKCNT